jgi:hypothetical protein
VLLLLVLAAVLLVVTPDCDQLVRNLDMGSQLSKGQQIRFGLHPFVDVDSSVYGPAIFYISALAQAVSGERVLAEVLVAFAGFVISYLLLFITLGRRTGSSWLLLVYGLLAVIAIPKFHKYHVLLPQALFLYGLDRALMMARRRQAALGLAVACVLAGLFRIDFGAYCVLVSVVMIVVRNAARGARAVLEGVAVLLVSGLLLISPWLVFLALAGDLPEIVPTSLATGAGVLHGLDTPLPPYQLAQSPLTGSNVLFILFWLFQLVPVAVLAGLLASRLRQKVRHRDQAADNDNLFLGLTAVFALLVYLQASYRIDLEHVRQGLPASLFVLFLVLARWRPRLAALPRPGRVAIVLGLLGLAGALALGLAHWRLTRASSYAPARWRQAAASWYLPRAEVLARGSTDLTRALQRARALTGPEEPILVLPYYPNAYYFAGRHFSTPFGWLNPGRFQRPGTLQRFYAGLASTDLVIDDPGFSFDGMDSRNARSYAPELMQHIYSRWGIFEVNGSFVLLSRRPSIWYEHGRYGLALKPIELGTVTIEQVDQQGLPCPIAAINTLAVQSGAVWVMPCGAGLMLEPRDCAETGHAIAGLLGSDRFYAVTWRGKPAWFDRVEPFGLVATAGVPPGDYRLVELPWPELDRVLDAGLVIRLEIR